MYYRLQSHCLQFSEAWPLWQYRQGAGLWWKGWGEMRGSRPEYHYLKGSRGSVTVARNRFFQLLSGWDLHCIIWMLLSVSENRQEFFPQPAPIWPWRREGGRPGDSSMWSSKYVLWPPPVPLPPTSPLPYWFPESHDLNIPEVGSQRCWRYFPF